MHNLTVTSEVWTLHAQQHSHRTVISSHGCCGWEYWRSEWGVVILVQSRLYSPCVWQQCTNNFLGVLYIDLRCFVFLWTAYLYFLPLFQHLLSTVIMMCTQGRLTFWYHWLGLWGFASALPHPLLFPLSIPECSFWKLFPSFHLHCDIFIKFLWNLEPGASVFAIFVFGPRTKRVLLYYVWWCFVDLWLLLTLQFWWLWAHLKALHFQDASHTHKHHIVHYPVEWKYSKIQISTERMSFSPKPICFVVPTRYHHQAKEIQWKSREGFYAKGEVADKAEWFV